MGWLIPIITTWLHLIFGVCVMVFCFCCSCLAYDFIKKIKGKF